MTNSDLLLDKINKSGLKRGFLAEKLDISYHWLNQKIQGNVPFKAYEIQILCELLNITSLKEKDDIFFAKNVEKSST